MTTQRQVAIKKSANKTKHQRAMANPKVQELAGNLARDWATMDDLKRGARLRELAAHGCSARGLEEVLKQSATSIRRHMAPEERPKTDRNEKEALASAQAHAFAQEAVNKRADAERDRCQRQRVIADEETGALSDEVATVILEFCRAGQGLPETPILPEEVPLLLSRAERYLSSFDASGRRPVRIPEDMDLKEIFRLARPDAQEGDPWMERHGKWLANVVWAKAPERRIWKPALGKAGGRAGELTPPRSQADRDRDRKERLSTIADLPVRLNRDVGARALGRQGRPTTPPAERL